MYMYIPIFPQEKKQARGITPGETTDILLKRWSLKKNPAE